MLDTTRMTTDGWTLAMHHDLWVELACTEMALEKLDPLTADAREAERLRQHCINLRHSLQDLPQ
ncbi:MAG TPA: hypothetical protein VF271_06635 [Rhodanobacteraceae bacterium]